MAFPSGLSTFLLGLGAGLARQVRPIRDAGLWGALAVAQGGTLVQRFLIAELTPPDIRAETLNLEIAIPIAVANAWAACCSFGSCAGPMPSDWLRCG